MSTITDFASQFRGGRRSNQYRVIGSFPAAVVGAVAASRKTEFMISAATIPGSTLGVIQVPYRGRVLKIAGDRTFDDWSITVLNDEDGLIRNAFESWSNLINGHLSNVGVLASANAYFATWQVEQLSRNGDVLDRYNIVDLWPSSVGDISIGHSETDSVQSFTVNLAYQLWTHVSPNVVTS